MIQETRRYILDILKTHGDLTVDEIVDNLHELTSKQVTAATIRHHLDILQRNSLVSTPMVRRRDTPGRPQYVYRLTDKARDYFPSNYVNLASSLLSQMKRQLDQPQINVILEGVGTELGAAAEVPEGSLEARLDYVVSFLNDQGYQATWENADGNGGFVLRTSNCPFQQVVSSHHDVCVIDMHLISALLGVVPRRLGRLAEGDVSCSYFIPYKEAALPAS